MDQNSKMANYNNSAYASRLADKQALFNSSNYGQKQALFKSSSVNKTNTTTKFTMPNGKVIVRNPQSNKIDFKTLFAGLNADNVDNTVSISNFKAISDNMMNSYANKSKTYLKQTPTRIIKP